MTPTKPGSASLPFFGIEPAIIDPISGREVTGNDVEGVLAIKKPWPSMARTVWGDHKRYMDTYLNQYKGYYVSSSCTMESLKLLLRKENSLQGTVLVVIMRDITGSEAVLTTLSMFPATGYLQPRLKQH